MKYKLPRQITSPEIDKVLRKEVRKQNIEVLRLTRKNLKEIAELSEVIQKFGLPEYLVCKKLPYDLGYGVFLHPGARPMPKDQVIGPYAGDTSIIAEKIRPEGSYAFTPIENIHLNKKEQQFFDKKNKFHPKRSYTFQIDAWKHGNFTRFINHSEKPNVVAHLFYAPSNACGLAKSVIEVIYFAKKTIRPGEQLLVSYEDEEDSYWGAVKIKPFPMTPKTFQLDASLRIVERSS